MVGIAAILTASIAARVWVSVWYSSVAVNLWAGNLYLLYNIFLEKVTIARLDTISCKAGDVLLFTVHMNEVQGLLVKTTLTSIGKTFVSPFRVTKQ